jgi:hypothetical protein
MVLAMAAPSRRLPAKVNGRRDFAATLAALSVDKPVRAQKKVAATICHQRKRLPNPGASPGIYIFDSLRVCSSRIPESEIV